MLQEIEQIGLKVLGPGHPHYLAIKTNLAKCYLRMGQLEKACEMFQENEQIQIKVLGPEHPHYLKTKKHLAECYSKMNDFGTSCKIQIKKKKN